jgi:hypothetical protein
MVISSEVRVIDVAEESDDVGRTYGGVAGSRGERNILQD